MVERQRYDDLAKVDRRMAAHVRDAKSAFGIWSDMGLAETRRM